LQGHRASPPFDHSREAAPEDTHAIWHPRQAVQSNRRVLVTLLAFVALAATIGGVAVAMQPSRSHVKPTTTRAGRPSIVFVLTDDLSMNLLQFMPHVQAMERRGLTFHDYFVSDSLCCPSRSSIFTGDFPHDTGVFSNVGAHGGYHVFYGRGEELGTFAVELRRAGYRTAMMGKYLNGYLDGPQAPAGLAPTHVPAGWSEWDVGGTAYPEFNYTLNENGELFAYGAQPEDYLTDVLARKGVDFIDSSAAARRPFFLELATYAPHDPYVPAPRNARDFPGLTVPAPPSFDTLPAHAPPWLQAHPPLLPAQIDQLDRVFRKRAQSVEAVDRMIGQIEQALADEGLARNTYLVFSSDNGFHAGEYRLMPGKMTAFDTDIRVPLVVIGPGVPAGTTNDAMVENIDLAKTFTNIGGTAMRGDGHSLLPLLHGDQPADWRDAILVEHHGPDLSGTDPDFQQTPSGNPRTYEAMRTHRYAYVEYNDGERELYDLRNDPYELHNIADRLTPQASALLHDELAAIENCHDGLACWRTMHVPETVQALHRRPRPRRARR
jgi:N-acetylglucosamine-6-sulfatase